MLNPTAILIAVLAAIGLLATGFVTGKTWSDRAYAAQERDVQKAAIAGANEATTAAITLAVQQIAKEADARVRAVGIRRKGEIDAALKARPECARDQQSMELLQSALDSANGTQADSSTMPDSVHPNTQSGE